MVYDSRLGDQGTVEGPNTFNWPHTLQIVPGRKQAK